MWSLIILTWLRGGERPSIADILPILNVLNMMESVDPRLELWTVQQMLSSDPNMKRPLEIPEPSTMKPVTAYYRMALNNWLQVHGGPREVRWEFAMEGPHNQPQWKARLYSSFLICIADEDLPTNITRHVVDGIARSIGTGPTKGSAKEQAAQEALTTLKQSLGYK
jgi:hypothetical protein